MPPKKRHTEPDASSVTNSRVTLSRAASLVLLIVLGCGVAYLARVSKASAIPRASFSQTISVHASGRGNPSINMSDGRDVLTSYSGPAALTQALDGPKLMVFEGKLTDGKSIEEAVPPGKIVLIKFINGDKTETVVPFKRQARST